MTILLTGCDSFLPYGRVFDIFKRDGTNWVSEDSNINIHINEDGSGDIELLIGDEKYNYTFHGLFNRVYIVDETGHRMDHWKVFCFPNSFRVKVEKSEFFEAGTKIKFYRIDE